MCHCQSSQRVRYPLRRTALATPSLVMITLNCPSFTHGLHMVMTTFLYNTVQSSLNSTEPTVHNKIQHSAIQYTTQCVRLSLCPPVRPSNQHGWLATNPLHTANCTLHTAHCMLHTANCTLHAVHFTMNTAKWTLNITQCILCYILYTEYSTLHIAHRTLNTECYTKCT